MSEPIPDELRAALDSIRTAQARLDEDRAKVREQILAAEPTWGPCLQCGHTWRSRNIRRRLGKPPRRCPKCLSSYWFDPEYTPRASQAKVAPGAESNGGQGQGTSESEGTAPAKNAPAAPFEMSPPPKFELPADDTLAMMKEARKDEKQ